MALFAFDLLLLPLRQQPMSLPVVNWSLPVMMMMPFCWASWVSVTTDSADDGAVVAAAEDAAEDNGDVVLASSMVAVETVAADHC